ncbi:hypothetical protein B0H13DRAFT_1914210 [Mycena leptocephala]|nr:hypothetical protein B0H13DRAFT_1914210 [Mycena leptocephala]
MDSIVVTSVLKFPELPDSFTPADCAAWLATANRIVPGLEWRRIYLHKRSIRVDYFVEFASSEIALKVKALINLKEGEIQESAFVGATEYGEIQRKLRAVLEQATHVTEEEKPPTPYAGGRYLRQEPPVTTHLPPTRATTATEMTRSPPIAGPSGSKARPELSVDPLGDLGPTGKESVGGGGVVLLLHSGMTIGSSHCLLTAHEALLGSLRRPDALALVHGLREGRGVRDVAWNGAGPAHVPTHNLVRGPASPASRHVDRDHDLLIDGLGLGRWSDSLAFGLQSNDSELAEVLPRAQTKAQSPDPPRGLGVGDVGLVESRNAHAETIRPTKGKRFRFPNRAFCCDSSQVPQRRKEK